MAFYLEKWYFDILTPDRDFIFFYLAIVQLFRHREARLNLNIVPSSGSGVISGAFDLKFKRDIIEISKSAIRTRYGNIFFYDTSAKIGLEIMGWSADLTYEYSLNRRETEVPLIIPDRKSSHRITWTPVCLKGKVSGSFSMDKNKFPIHGLYGYIDHVCSDVYPRKSPIQILYWGRLHHEICDLTYSIAESAEKKERWSKLYLWHDGSVIELEDLEIVEGKYLHLQDLDIQYPQWYEIKSAKPGVFLEVKVKNVVNAIQSAFIDSKKFSGLKRKLLNFVSKDPRGIKFISKADVNLVCKGKTYKIKEIEFISEYVEFV